MRLGTEALFQFSLNGCCTLMHDIQGQSSVHAHMDLNGDAIADATSAKVVRLLHVVERLDNLLNLLFRLCRQRAFR